MVNHFLQLFHDAPTFSCLLVFISGPVLQFSYSTFEATLGSSIKDVRTGGRGQGHADVRTTRPKIGWKTASKSVKNRAKTVKIRSFSGINAHFTDLSATVTRQIRLWNTRNVAFAPLKHSPLKTRVQPLELCIYRWLRTRDTPGCNLPPPPNCNMRM